MHSPDPFTPRPYVRLTHPDWCANSSLYQINTRQFTDAGTFKAAAQHLPRLADLGVGILWLMPVHEIGSVNRKGTLGSPYAVRDYYRVNPEFGTMADLRDFVEEAHALGMRVILDWVANHTAWDCTLVTEHPEWYARDERGCLSPTPWWDWDDIVDLDYRHTGLRRWMADAMAYWIREVDADGFRCDTAGFVPIDFWVAVRRELEQIKPVFMLAEWESRDLHAEAFDASYAWSWNDAMHRIAHGRLGLDAMAVYYSWNDKFWPHDSLRMTFVSNHDKNAWEGTEFEQFGEALEIAVVLSVVGEGIPLIYNGQEAGHDKRLSFFDRDPIVWREHPMGELYRRLIALKRERRVLWNGAWGARMRPVTTDATEHVLAFVRGDGPGRVLAAFNLAPTHLRVTMAGDRHVGEWSDWATGEPLRLDAGSRLDLPAWGHRVLLG